MENRTMKIRLDLLEQKQKALGIKMELLNEYEKALDAGNIHAMYQISISYNECDRILNRVDRMLELQDIISSL